MFKWNCKTKSKEALKINNQPFLLWPNALHLLRWWYIICFLSERRTYFPWLMPAYSSRTPALYTHADFELWKGRGMKSRPSRNMLLKTGAVWLLLLLLQLLHAAPRGLHFRHGNKQRSGVCIMMIMMLYTCSEPQVWFVVDSNSTLGKNSLWENYTHCSAWKCFLFLSVFVQCEEPDSRRPKIQNYHCFFKGRCMQSPTFIVTSKCQLYL